MRPAGRCRAIAIRAIVIGVAIPTVGWPRPALAQIDAWREAASTHFLVVYRPGDEARRDLVIEGAEDAYADVAAAFGREITGTITVRLFDNADAYFRENPMALDQDGVLVQAHRGRRDIGLFASRLDADGPDGVANALRYELGHLHTYELSDGRLPSALQEGVARYLEQPGESRAGSVARLRDAASAGRLRGWRELAAPGAIFSEPLLTQAEALSIVHFLVGSHGWPRLLSLLSNVADEADWSRAVAATYGVSVADLEAEWRAWLPGYLDGGWRNHVLYRGDLGAACELMARGEHEVAKTQLAGAAAYLRRSDPAAADEAGRLLAIADAAASARKELTRALELLSAGEYRPARDVAARASESLARADDSDGKALADEVAGRADVGVEADEALSRAHGLPPWRIAQARLLGYRALEGYARLGNDLAASRARALVAELDRRQAPAGWALLGVGVALVGWNLWRRSRDAAMERG